MRKKTELMIDIEDRRVRMSSIDRSWHFTYEIAEMILGKFSIDDEELMIDISILNDVEAVLDESCWEYPQPSDNHIRDRIKVVLKSNSNARTSR